MAEYIEREAALDICNTEYHNRLKMFDYCGDTVAWNISNQIKTLPVADVAPVVHGRWIATHDEFCSCSLCKYPVYVDWNQTNYCPNCGAKMDLEEEK